MRVNMPASLAVVIGVAATLAGCSSDESPALSSTAEGVAAFATEAKAGGADASQVDLMADGVVDYADYEAAMNSYAQCVEDRGLVATIGDPSTVQGVTQIVVDVTLPEGGDPGQIDDCYVRKAKYIDMYWQTSSPDAMAFSERRAHALKPQLEECLAGYQVDFPEDAAFDELVDVAIQHFSEVQTENCMHDINFTFWEG